MLPQGLGLGLVLSNIPLTVGSNAPHASVPMTPNSGVVSMMEGKDASLLQTNLTRIKTLACANLRK